MTDRKAKIFILSCIFIIIGLAIVKAKPKKLKITDVGIQGAK